MTETRIWRIGERARVGCGALLVLVTLMATAVAQLVGMGPAAAADIVLAENFNSVTPPALPAGWITQNLAGAKSLPWTSSCSNVSCGDKSVSAGASAPYDTVTYLQSPWFTAPANGVLTFSNKVVGLVHMDGTLQVSSSAGTVDILKAGGSFTGGGYNSTGTSWEGYLSATTTANLPASLTGQSIALRWLLQGDGSMHEDGDWTIDDVSVTGTLPATVTINQASGTADPTVNHPTFTVTFSRSVTGFTASDVSFAGSTAPGKLSASVTGGPATYTVLASGMTGPGVVKASIPANVVTGGNIASTSTDNAVTYNGTSVTINQASGQADPTIDAPLNFTVVFGRAVTGFTDGDVSFLGPQAPGKLAARVTGSGTTYNVAVSGMTGPGVVKPSIAINVVDGGNAISTSTDNQVTYSAAGVSVIQASGQADPASSGPINFTVVFSRAVTGFGDSAADVSFAGSTAPGPLAASVTGSGTTYNVAVTGMAGYGTVKLAIPANVVTGGNAPSTSTDNAVTYVPATVTINQASTQADPTSTPSIRFTVVFSKAVTGFTASDVSVVSTQPAAPTKTVSGSGTTYTVTLTGMTTSGAVKASVPANVVTGGNAPSTSTDNSVTFTKA